jgi:hippurate hydrolase
VSRELKPGTPAVVTVGTIRGGTKRNIISEEVKLELTLRSYDDKVTEQMIAAIKRICAGTAAAAGVPEDRMPVVTVLSESAHVMVNTVDLTRRVTATFGQWFGAEGVESVPPITGAEDFSEFGRTLPAVPLFMWWVGAADPAKVAAANKAGVQMPSNHSPIAAFVPEPTLEVCVTSTTAAVLDLLGKK